MRNCITLTLLGTALVAGGMEGAALRADDVTDIIINEVMYNPSSGDRQEDFLELYNRSATQSYNLRNFSFTSGLVFTFPDIVIGPEQYLVVCANQARIRQIYGINNTVGDWDPSSTLDNGGERLKLVNAAGIEVEDFTYDDRNPWPILADGFGHSLERRNPDYDNDDPANWSASAVGSGWTRVVVTGNASSSVLYLYLTAAGVAYVDDIRLYPVGNPGDNRIQNGGFESSLTPWTAAGNHSGSTSSLEQAHSGSRSLKLSATGAGSSSSTSVSQSNLGLVIDAQYTLEFWLLLTEPGQTMIARLSGSGGQAEPLFVEAGGGGASPGRRNSVFAADTPPFIYPVDRSPEVPKSNTDVTITALVRDDNSVSSVVLHYDSGAGEQTAPMFDDGAHGDGAQGDGVYGAGIGRFSTGTIVRYWVSASDGAAQEGRFPFAGNPTPVLGFYVEPLNINPAFQPRSNSGLVSDKPAVYHLLIDPSQLDGSGHLNGSLTTYRRGTFIYNGEVFENVRIRHRGQTSLGVSKKHWKVDFNKDHRFLTPFAGHPEVDNINLQSSYGDKTFLREWLGYKAWMDLGEPGLEMWHVRMYLNGAYRGLYIHLENPDDDWMNRSGLDNEGWLWKAYSEAKGGTGGFEMEEDAGNPSAANSALASFISNMNSLSGQALENYINANMNVDGFIDFLALHQLIHNCDHPAKNYLVYADEDSPAGTWNYYGWDFDLTHGRNFECAGGGVLNDTIRSDMFGDPQLLFGTSQRPKCDGPWNGVINGFLVRTTAFRDRYYARTAELLDLLYHPDVLNPIIDDMAAPLGSEVNLDWNRNTPYGNRSTHAFHVNALKSWVQNRYTYIANALTNLTAPELDRLACARSGDNVNLSWTNHGAYTLIHVYRNNALLRTLSGSATSTSVALDLNQTVNSFRVASILGGVERAGQSCTIILSTGGFAKVIDEDFSPPASAAVLSVNCNATQESGVLQLTPPANSQAGSAFFRTPYPNGDFIADFDLNFADPTAEGADGMVFILSTSSSIDRCGAAGGAMGYFTGDGGTPTFPGYAIVLDTWQNPGEISHNWAGFIDAARGGAPQKAVDVPEEFNGNGIFHATVIGSEGVFTLLLSNPSLGMAEREIFTHAVPGFAEQDTYFGFSAGTGGAFARHIVDNFVLQIGTDQPDPVIAGFNAAPASGNTPLEVAFTNTSTGATSYQWAFGDGGTSNQIHPTHIYTAPGTYSVSLTANGPGGSDTLARPSLITVTEAALAEFTAAPVSGKFPLAVQFTSQSTGTIAGYQWDFGDGSGSVAANPGHTYQQPGEYTVTLSLLPNGPGSTRTRTNFIRVDDDLRAEFVASPLQGDAPLSVRFLDASRGSTITRWVWNFGDDSGFSFERNPTHVYSKDGLYTATLQIVGFTESDSLIKAGYIRVGSGGIFLRGEVNGDGSIDLSDAVSILEFAFLGGDAPACFDAADADDSGEIDITDAVRILGHLFLGEGPPAPPFPNPGTDPTPDLLPPCP